ncbi:hypothetical protein ACI79C_17005 [Geodermatophilus sp. SYSU D00697]
MLRGRDRECAAPDRLVARGGSWSWHPREVFAEFDTSSRRQLHGALPESGPAG